jgi:GH18 family chitinase
VSGYFRQGNEDRKEFCYLYYPWNSGERPDGVDQFYPCDFNLRLAHILYAHASIHAHASVNVEFEHIKRQEGPEKSDDQEGED